MCFTSDTWVFGTGKCLLRFRSHEHTPRHVLTARRQKDFLGRNVDTYWIALRARTIVVSWRGGDSTNDLPGRRVQVRRNSWRAGDAGDRRHARGVWDPESGFPRARQDGACGVRRVAVERGSGGEIAAAGRNRCARPAGPGVSSGGGLSEGEVAKCGTRPEGEMQR